MGKQIKVVSDLDINNSIVTNANINAQNNTITNLEVSNFKSGVIQTTVRDTTNALDTAIPTEKAVSEALSNIQVNVIELDEGTNIDNLRQEGTFFIKNPTGTLPASVSTGNTYWCILTQEKCYDDLNLGTYWYLQTAKFSYLGMGPGMGSLQSWQTFTRQITDYTYIQGANVWQRLDNLAERFFSNTPGTEGADLTIDVSTCSDAESVAIVNAGWITGSSWRSIKSLTLSTGLLGSCKIFFKTYNGGTPPYTPFSITLDGTISSQIINPDVLTNYKFKASTVYEIDFQKIGSIDGKVSVQVTEINKPFVQEYFPAQTGNSGKFLTTDGTTMSWVTVDQQSTQVNTFNGTLTSNTLSLNTEIDLSDSIILAVYVNGVYQIDSTHYSITTSSGESTVTFTSAFNEDVEVSIVYATDVNLMSISYNDLTDKPTIDTLLPSQTGQSGKFLTTNGSTASWTTVSGGTTDYTDLTNKPSINGVTLTGNVSLSSLGVQSKNLVFENTTADSWVISDPNVYPDYVYECTVSCPGATTNSFAQVVFGPGEFDSGNYANVCSTGQDSVTMYSKVNDTINIPTIIIMGV